VSTLRIATTGNGTWFHPGGTLDGAISWEIAPGAAALELRLFWYTSGKGTEEAEIVDSLRVERPETAGERPFRFDLPEGPCSFSGRLITLRWALELVLEPSEEVERLDLLVAPRPVEIDIRHLREL
jgi:hypothetical protein